MENDSHVILLTYRPVDEFGNPTGEDELIIAKQRHGPVSNERVFFDSKTLTFFGREVFVESVTSGGAFQKPPEIAARKLFSSRK